MDGVILQRSRAGTESKIILCIICSEVESDKETPSWADLLHSRWDPTPLPHLFPSTPLLSLTWDFSGLTGSVEVLPASICGPSRKERNDRKSRNSWSPVRYLVQWTVYSRFDVIGSDIPAYNYSRKHIRYGLVYLVCLDCFRTRFLITVCKVWFFSYHYWSCLD